MPESISIVTTGDYGILTHTDINGAVKDYEFYPPTARGFFNPVENGDKDYVEIGLPNQVFLKIFAVNITVNSVVSVSLATARVALRTVFFLGDSGGNLSPEDQEKLDAITLNDDGQIVYEFDAVGEEVRPDVIAAAKAAVASPFYVLGSDSANIGPITGALIMPAGAFIIDRTDPEQFYIIEASADNIVVKRRYGGNELALDISGWAPRFQNLGMSGEDLIVNGTTTATERPTLAATRAGAYWRMGYKPVNASANTAGASIQNTVWFYRKVDSVFNRWYASFKFGVRTYGTTSRIFAGLTAALFNTSTTILAALNFVGLIKEAATPTSGNWSLGFNGASGNATFVTLGASFPLTDPMHLELWGYGEDIYVRVRNLATDAVFTRIVLSTETVPLSTIFVLPIVQGVPTVTAEQLPVMDFGKHVLRFTR